MWSARFFPERPARATLGVIVQCGVGFLLLGGAALAGLALVRRPWPNRLDAIGLRLLPVNLQAHWAHDAVGLGSLPALLVGVLVVLLVGVRRNWVRALACATAPLLAVVIVQEIAKPLVDRHSVISGSLTYPSGTVAAVAALATAATLVAPRRARIVVGLAGVAAVVAASAAVVVLRWHYPTDALGGLAVGTGSVLLVDALADGARHVFRSWRELTCSQPPMGAQSLRSTVVRARDHNAGEWPHEWRRETSLRAH